MKAKHRIFLTVALIAITSYVVVRQITPDVCWPNSAMLAFIVTVSGIFILSIALFIEGLQRIKKLGTIAQVPLQFFAIFVSAGIMISLTEIILVNIGQRLNSEDTMCFSSLSSNYLNRYVEIFWILIFSGLFLMVSNLFYKKSRKNGGDN